MRLRPLVALLLVSSCRCADFNENLIYRCGAGGECESGTTCVDGYCVVPPAADGGPPDAGCMPSRACTIEECGVFGDDGCGTPLDCGICQLPFICGVETPNRCGCVPADAGAQVCPPPPEDGGVSCGAITVDNCGAFDTFTCGPACPVGSLCVDNVCCTPLTDAVLCARGDFGCGPGDVIDCGIRRPLDCGACAGNQICTFDDLGSRCVSVVCTAQSDFEFCETRGANCGLVTGPDNCGAMRVDVSCGGGCDAGGCTNPLPNQCTCQNVLTGCSHNSQCCTGLTCGDSNLCCAPNGTSCNDDSDCCLDSCQLGACCLNAGRSCTSGSECCTGVCNSDGGCEGFDGGPGLDDGGVEL